MDRKKLFNVLRIVVSVGLIIFVCSQIRLSDRLVLKPGVLPGGQVELTGRLQPSPPGTFVLRIDGKVEGIDEKDLVHDASGNLTGVRRGLITVFRDIDWWWFVPTFLWVGLVPTIGALRWRMLLKLQGIRLTAGRAVSLTFLGYFFNNFLLGLTGGDVVKAYYVTRETRHKTEAVVTVFLDRVIGLIALAIFAATMVLWRLNDPKFHNAAVTIYVFMVMSFYCLLVLYSRRLRRRLHYTMLGVAALGGALIFGLRWYHRGWAAVQNQVLIFVVIIAIMAVFLLVAPLRRMIRIDALLAKLANNRRVREMDKAFHVFSQHRGVTVAVFGVSFLCHFITLSGVWGFARALGINDVPFRYFLVFVPVIVMISAMPISLAGWGVQEAVYQAFFATVGVGATEAITLSFIYRLCAAVLWSLPGGLAWMLSKDRTTLHDAEKALAEETAA